MRLFEKNLDPAVARPGDRAAGRIARVMMSVPIDDEALGVEPKPIDQNPRDRTRARARELPVGGKARTADRTIVAVTRA